MKNTHLTLEDLERDKWGEPEFNSHLVTECHRLRKIPINQFSVENLRIMIGQGFSLKFLVPIAIEKLWENPFAEGDFYRGDLLLAVLSIKPEFWVENPKLHQDLEDIVQEAEKLSEFVISELRPAWAKVI